MPGFSGDPGVGKVISGCSVKTETSTIPDGVTWLDNNTTGTKKHVLARIYGTPGSGASNQRMDWTLIDAQVALGRIPVPSCKYLYRDTSPNARVYLPDIINGSMDVQITKDAAAMKTRLQAGHIIWFSPLGHESFDDYPVNGNANGETSAMFRQAWRRCASIFRTELAGLEDMFEMIGPIGQGYWEYIAGGISARGGESYHGDPAWKGTKSGPNSTVVAADWYTDNLVPTLWAMDQYSPLTGSTNYYSFGVQYRTCIDKNISWGRPPLCAVIPEIGTYSSVPQANWVNHWRGTPDSVMEVGLYEYPEWPVVGYCIFEYGTNASFHAGPEGPLRLAGYDPFFNDPRVIGI